MPMPQPQPVVLLSNILPHLPDRQFEDRPAYLRTMALFGALKHLGCPCRLWNAVIESPWKTQVIAAVQMHEQLLDWHGLRPHDYPLVFAIHAGGRLEREGLHEIVAEDLIKAARRHPEILGQARVALQYAALEKATTQAQGEPGPSRL